MKRLVFFVFLAVTHDCAHVGRLRDFHRQAKRDDGQRRTAVGLDDQQVAGFELEDSTMAAARLLADAINRLNVLTESAETHKKFMRLYQEAAKRQHSLESFVRPDFDRRQ